MKYRALTPFQKHLESAAPDHFSSTYLIISKDRFERTYLLDQCIEAIVPSAQERTLFVKRFEAAQFHPSQLQAEMGAFSLFGGKQVIVIQGIESFKAPIRDALLDTLKDELVNITLILVGESLPSNTKLYKRLEKVGVVFDPGAGMKPWEKEDALRIWLEQETVKEGIKIDSGAARLLIQQIGPEHALLYQELQKLICFVGERRAITQADVSAVSLRVSHETVWQLGEAVFQTEASRAHFLTRRLLLEGLQPLGLIGQLRRQVQTDFQVLDALEKGGGPSEIQQKFPYFRGKILDRHIACAKKYGKKRFQNALIALHETEFRLKDAAVDGTLLIEQLVIRLCQ